MYFFFNFFSLFFLYIFTFLSHKLECTLSCTPLGVHFVLKSSFWGVTIVIIQELFTKLTNQLHTVSIADQSHAEKSVTWFECYIFDPNFEQKFAFTRISPQFSAKIVWYTFCRSHLRKSNLVVVTYVNLILSKLPTEI